MSKASTSCFRVTLIVAIVCFAIVAGHADIIPELTGTFDVLGNGNPDGSTGVFLVSSTRLEGSGTGVAGIMST